MISEMDRHHVTGAFRPGEGRRAGESRLLRAVVLRSYAPGEEAEGKPDHCRQGVTCDLLVFANRMRSKLHRVPVCLPGAGGIGDGNDWKPRGTTRNLGGGALVLQGAPGAVTPAHDMDGDHVLVDFMQGDLGHPLIVGSLPHPRRKAPPSEGWPLRRRVRGAVVGVDAVGSVHLDTTLASSGAVGADGSEDQGGTGDLALTLKGSLGLSVDEDAVAEVTGDVTLDAASVTVNGGTQGAARKTDAVKITITQLDADAVYQLVAALLSTGLFTPNPVTPPAPTLLIPTPIEFTGQITGGSGSVKVGD